LQSSNIHSCLHNKSPGYAEAVNFRHVQLAGKTADADADADLLFEKNTVISLKRYG